MTASKGVSRIRSQLLLAKQKRLIVQFGRPFEPGKFTGYVMDVSPAFFLFASLNDGFEFEQFTCLRIGDVRRLECPAEYAEFYTRVRRLRGDKFPTPVKLDLSDTVSILDSVRTPLITLHREQVDPDKCMIGCMLSRNKTTKTTLELLEIGPDAKWETKPTYVRINQITRIDLPGSYERALLMVGGKPQVQ